MTELTQTKRRVRALEKCLRAVSAMLYERAVELNAAGTDREDRLEYHLIVRIHSRIERTLSNTRGWSSSKPNDENAID
jgi:hypothetical protein